MVHPRLLRVGIGVTGVIAGTGIAIGIEGWRRQGRELTFDSQRWRTPAHESDRARMARWIVRTGFLDGRTEAEVLDLLGRRTTVDRDLAGWWVRDDGARNPRDELRVEWDAQRRACRVWLADQ